MLPVVLVDELLRLYGIGVKLAESVFSSGDGGFHPIQAPVRDYTPGSDEHGPGFNRGSGGGARGCDFEERVGAYARTEGGRFL